MLTDTAIKRAKPKDKPYRLTDGRGLYLLVNPNGSKYWRLDYAVGGRRNTLSLGRPYADTPLALARERCDEARKLIAAGIGPRRAAQGRQDRRRGARDQHLRGRCP